jgi:hypothetical protein
LKLVISNLMEDDWLMGEDEVNEIDQQRRLAENEAF